MQFPTQFPFLVIPTGAGPGQQRITINYGQDGKIKVYDSSGNLVDALGGPQGQLILYDTSGNMVVSLASAAGIDDKTGLPFQAGITAYTATTAINFLGNDGTWTAADGSKVVVEAAAGASIFLLPQGVGPWLSAVLETTVVLTRPSVSLASPSDTTNGNFSQLILRGSTTTSASTSASLTADTIDLNGVVHSTSYVNGSVTITPVANTPTSVTVNYGPLVGTAFRGQATASTTVIGTQVLGVAITSVTSTSAVVWVTRTNTTNTVVFWEVRGT